MKNNATIIALVSVALGVVFMLLFVFFSYISLSNSEVRLRNGIEAQQESCENYFTQMWAIVSQRANVTQEHQSAFREVYADIMQYQPGAGDGQDPLFVFLNNTMPVYDQSLYRDLANRIDSLRVEFRHEQDRLIDMHREHRDLIMTFPGSFLLASRGEVEITVLSSSRTEEIYSTGMEDSLQVFQKLFEKNVIKFEKEYSK